MSRGARARERDVREAYAAHSGELYDLAARSLSDSGLAEEAVQETFLRAWRAGDRFDKATGNLRTRLFAILRDVMIELGRARAACSGGADGGVEVELERLEQSLLAWRVERAMCTIGEQHRQVLVETYYRGRPYAEVAAELGVLEGTVRSRVHDGLRALKVALEEEPLW
ncbi:MAG TPA: sigma-70 family RNA polymerase sigma factor [Solirubrobacterales bacterium]|jgi:RNA polymerase sigma-70 factor (ECF subfamily)|nr:sigma-70 family RNA polymerase sigma factor [Solirubrobacterales bacterium]